MIKKSQTTTILPEQEIDEQRAAWRKDLEQLMREIQRWCKKHRWLADLQESDLGEEPFGEYRAPTLHIHAGGGALVVEPVGRNIVGAEGRVDIYSIRTFARLLLVRKKGQWHIYTDARVEWPEPWNERSFVKLVGTLTKP